MKTKITALIMLFSLFVLIAGTIYLLYAKNTKSTQFPFKCLFFTHYELNESGTKIIIDVEQDLRLYSGNSGYFLINGKAMVNGKEMQVNRAVILGNGNFFQGKTFRYHIEKSEKSDSDDMPDNFFNTFLTEFTTAPGNFQIDVFRLDEKSSLIGGPYSFLSSCMKY